MPTNKPRHIDAIQLRQANRTLRLAKVNDFLSVIGTRGRQFFWCEQTQKMAHLVMHQDRIYYVHEKTSEQIRLNGGKTRPGKWAGFTHGNTLRGLIECCVTFIRTGRQLRSEWVCTQWGYTELAIDQIRQHGIYSGILRPLETKESS